MLSTISSSGIRSAMATSALIMSSAGCSHISTRKLAERAQDPRNLIMARRGNPAGPLAAGRIAGITLRRLAPRGEQAAGQQRVKLPTPPWTGIRKDLT
ncbi:hypothetical protein [Arthrobacter sp. A5]|uniref:hypothetical protein n=1 Tax=Arthrobacter sp. A5 TaxID=576926 RepID=UPI003DA8BFEA